MAISRGVNTTFTPNTTTLAISSLCATATAGQVAVVSGQSGSNGSPIVFPAGWTVWVNALTAANGNFGFVASKVITAGDISGSGGTISNLSANACALVLATYNGNSPTVDTGSAAFDYVNPNSSGSATIGGVVVTPTYTSEWLVGILFGKELLSPTVGGSVSLSAVATSYFYEGLAVGHFDSNGTIAASPQTETFTARSGYAYTYEGILLCIQDISPPNPPTLLAPANGSYADMSQAVVFSATYNSTDTQNQNAYAFRIKASGGSYNYWNAGTSALQGTIVWNAITTVAGANFTLSLPGGTETDGYTYDWNFASQEAGANLQSGFAGSDFVLVGQGAPTLSVTAPTGSVSTSLPTILWTTSPASGAVQTYYRAVVYTAAQQGIGGFTPGVSPSTWDSTLTSGTNQSVTVSTTLQNATTYYAYVQVTETGGVTSSWEYTSFTTALDMPNAPGVTASAGLDTNGVPCIILTVQGYDNILSGQDSTLSASASWTWVAGANTTISQSSAQVDTGSQFSLKMVATTAGNISATTATTAYAVSPSATYTVQAAFRAATTARACTVGVSWYSVGGSLLSTNTSGSVNDSTSAWVIATENVTAPASASYAKVTVTVTSSAGSADFHYVGNIGLSPGSSTPWDLGGFAGLAQLTLLRSDGVYVRGAGYSTTYQTPSIGYNTTTIPVPSQKVIVNDYEAVPGTTYTYSGVIAFSANYGTVSSSAGISNSADLTLNSWWFIEPLTPSASIALSVVSFNVSQFESIAVHYPVVTPGQPVPPTTVSGGIFNPDGEIATQTQTQAQYASLQAEINSGTIKWLISPQGSGEYARISGANPVGGSAGSAQATQQTPGFASNPYRATTLNYVSAARP
jgi:hypothetical protein